MHVGEVEPINVYDDATRKSLFVPYGSKTTLREESASSKDFGIKQLCSFK